MGKAKVSAGPKIQSIEGSRLFEAEAKRADVTRNTDRFAAAKRSVCCFRCQTSAFDSESSREAVRLLISLSNFSF